MPVYNGKEMIGSVDQQLLDHAYRHIIIVDDGSDDNVKSVLQDLPVHFIRPPLNLGQGAALQTGFDYAKRLRCDVVVTFDADGQHDHSDIPDLIEPVLKGDADIVFGSRFIGDTKSNVPQVR